MMEEEAGGLAAKPQISYFGTGRRMAGRTAAGLPVHLLNQICDIKWLKAPISHKDTLGLSRKKT